MRTMKKSARVATIAWIALLASASPSNAAARQDAVGPQTVNSRAEAERIVLVDVDGHPLTLADAMDAFTATHTGHGVLVRGEAALRELMGRVIERQLFLAEAEALGLHDDPVLRGAMENALREEIVQAFWKRELHDKIQVGEEEVESFYAKTDVALKLTLIETRERASCEKLRARVEAGEDMSALASTESTHASRSFGGLLPYVRRGEIESALEKEVFALEAPKSLSPVVATEKGFAFARLEERSVNPTRLPREVALPQIRKILRDRYEDKQRAEIEARLEKEGEVTYAEALLLPEMVLDKGDPAAIVARSRGKALALKELRESLDVDALRQKDPETVQGAARYIARDWAMRMVIWDASEKDGTRADPDIARRMTRQERESVLTLLCERYVYADIDPKEEDLRAYYEANKATSFTRPPERRLAYIVVATKDEADKLLARIRAGESFEALAKQASIDRTSAAHGGRIGWIKKGDILAEVEARAFAIAKGAVDGPIETSAGWFLVNVLETKEPELVPYAGARTAVMKRLVKERQKEAWAKWAARLRERASVRIDEEGLRAAVEWLAKQPTAEAKPIDPNVPHAEPGEKPGAPKSGEPQPKDGKG